MSNHSRVLIGLLNITLFGALRPTSVSVSVQIPTKTPIGAPPTKASLSEVLPTKTGLLALQGVEGLTDGRAVMEVTQAARDLPCARWQ